MKNLGFQYRIVRTNRQRTASISVKEDAVQVTVPNTLAKEKIQQIVSKKTRWIKEKLDYYRQTRIQSKPKEYVSGEAFPYLGRNYRLKILSGKLARIKLKEGRLVVHIPKEFSREEKAAAVKELLTEWYQERALAKLKEKAGKLAVKIGVVPKSIEIKTYKSRWGSCTKKREVFFNWHVVMAPNRIVDYVVAHELVHLIHHDHGKAYWKKLKSIFPDYLECKEWLKANGRSLEL